MRPWLVWMSVQIMIYVLMFVFWTTTNMVSHMGDTSMLGYALEFLTLCKLFYGSISLLKAFDIHLALFMSRMCFSITGTQYIISSILSSLSIQQYNIWYWYRDHVELFEPNSVVSAGFIQLGQIRSVNNSAYLEQSRLRDISDLISLYLFIYFICVFFLLFFSNSFLHVGPCCKLLRLARKGQRIRRETQKFEQSTLVQLCLIQKYKFKDNGILFCCCLFVFIIIFYCNCLFKTEDCYYELLERIYRVKSQQARSQSICIINCSVLNFAQLHVVGSVDMFLND